MAVRRQLVEAASKEKLPIKMSMGEQAQKVFNKHEDNDGAGRSGAAR